MLEVTKETIDKVYRDYHPTKDQQYVRVIVGPG